ncbi:MAG: sulfurtransferase complex subunit TusC [Gammaproteobacteria bacterium]|nr:sulfurtransferase complex subunit TusC [Gammaproteobacteria bacterium]
MKKQLLIFTKPPYGSDSGKESLDMALAFATFDQPTSLLFLDAGVFQLLENQHPKLTGQKEYTRLFSGLDLYDIDSIYVAKADLDKYNIAAEGLIADPEMLDPEAIKLLIDGHERVTCL